MMALVTCGGTRENIDDVRVLTNLSTGRFGVSIAKALVKLGCSVSLLAADGVVCRASPSLRVRRFCSSCDLESVLEDEFSLTRYRIVVMSAAVSDYIPLRFSTKLDSSLERLTIELVRRPKIISKLRSWAGELATIVGFKLLSHATLDELRQASAKLMSDNFLDFVVGNDLRELGGGLHPVMLYQQSAFPVPIRGSRTYVAASLAKSIMQYERAGL